MSENTDEKLEMRKRLQEQSSMQHWWPRVRGLDVPTPTTIRLGAEPQPVEDGSLKLPIPSPDDVADGVREVGGPPAFLRSDQMGSKHSMAKGSRIQSDDPGEISIGGLIEPHFGFGAPEPECYYLREWLDLWHKFRSFADSSTPIAAEVRTFIYDGAFHDSDFYWPEDSIWPHAATEDNWPDLLQKTKERALQDSPVWTDHSETVATEFDTGYWSVDFALEESGTWYLIDMARGELSWHPEGCSKPEAIQE